MSKSKTPLFSFSARGSIGDTLTLQKRGQNTLVRTKPTPTDPYTIAQAYQRWDYQDYAYLWTLETAESKQTYLTRASRYHMTGFSLWMREHLRDLPDLAGRWHLDEKSGAIVHDSSRNLNNGTIFGASPTIGRIDNAYHFDGINDRIVVSDHASLDLTAALTIEAFCYLENIAGRQILSKRKVWGTDIPYELQGNSDIFYFATFDGVNNNLISTPPGSRIVGVWQHIAVVFNSIDIRVYIDGDLATAPSARTAPLISNDRDLWIGSMSGGAEWYYGIIDNVIIYNRALDTTEIKRHSERRYPP